jgi:rhodanese-related sulfurtransferase
LPLADRSKLEKTSALVVDVRSESEFNAGHIENAWNIPLETLRNRSQELPLDREIWLVCGVGQRSYYALRLLLQNGFQVKILSGGMETYQAWLQTGNF